MRALAGMWAVALASGTLAAGAARAEPAALSEDMAEPYFAAGPAGEAAARFALEDFGAARDGFARLLAAKPRGRSAEDRARLGLMVALSEAQLGRWADAAAGFARAAEGLPLLADYAHYQAARAWYFARDLDRALAHAAKIGADSRHAADGRLLVGDILRARGSAAEVAAHYAKYLADFPRGIRMAEARFRQAEALEALGRPAAQPLALYRKVLVSAPLSSWAEKAQARVDALARALPKKQRARATGWSAAELIERGMQYYDAMRNPQSEADFAAALKAPGLTAAQRCVAAYHRANSVFKQRDRTRAAPLFDAASKACAGTGNTDLEVKSAYQGGRSYGMTGRYEEAIVRYARAERLAAGGHSYGDDARLRQAEAAEELGKDDRVTELLSSLPARYPDGDMRAEALWRLAWRAWKAKDHAQAVRWLKAQIAAVPLDDNYWAEGQPQYWLGRAYTALGRKAEAVAAWTECVRAYPLSYYALLALNRLREHHPAELAKLSAELAAAPAAAGPAFTFKPRAVYGEPGFQRAIEFLRLGLGADAQAELARLGLGVPPGKHKVTDPDRLEQLWAIAFLYDRAGRHDQSHWIARWHAVDYKRAWPVGANRARWRIAYPLAYWPLLEGAAREQGFPPELIIAFVREESAFNPLLESFANAIGLTQMIFPTARRFAKGLDLTVSRETLRDPVKNVAIGSRFLAFLWKKFDGKVGLVVPSYNAGEGATGRWLRQRGDWPLDEFAEEIPYDETRRYSKRVIASYFTYAYLKDGTIPVMPN